MHLQELPAQSKMSEEMKDSVPDPTPVKQKGKAAAAEEEGKKPNPTPPKPKSKPGKGKGKAKFTVANKEGEVSRGDHSKAFKDAVCRSPDLDYGWLLHLLAIGAQAATEEVE